MLFIARNNVPAMTDGSPTGSFFCRRYAGIVLCRAVFEIRALRPTDL